MADITTPYDALARNHGIKLVRDTASAIDVDKRQVRLAKGDVLAFDRVIVAPGIDFMCEALPEYRPNNKVIDVDVKGNTLKLEIDDIKANVLNVLPPMKAGNIATAFITANERWCEVDWLTYESKVTKGVHLLGDALQIAPAMPKSGHMANAHGKACAAAVVALLNNEAPNPSPTLTNTCYSFVSDTQAVHVASVHKYDAKDKTMKTVLGAGGVSSAMNELEAAYGLNWARNIWADTLG